MAFSGIKIDDQPIATIPPVPKIETYSRGQTTQEGKWRIRRITKLTYTFDPLSDQSNSIIFESPVYAWREEVDAKKGARVINEDIFFQETHDFMREAGL